MTEPSLLRSRSLQRLAVRLLVLVAGTLCTCRLLSVYWGGSEPFVDPLGVFRRSGEHDPLLDRSDQSDLVAAAVRALRSDLDRRWASLDRDAVEKRFNIQYRISNLEEYEAASGASAGHVARLRRTPLPRRRGTPSCWTWSRRDWRRTGSCSSAGPRTSCRPCWAFLGRMLCEWLCGFPSASHQMAPPR